MNPSGPDSLLVIAMAAQGGGLSGGDRIFLELSRRWSSYGVPITIGVSQEGKAMCLRNNIDKSLIAEWDLSRLHRSRLFQYLALTVRAMCKVSPTVRMTGCNTVYSASDFWPDVVPAFAAKCRYHVKWIAGFYMFAPPPHRGFVGRVRSGIPRITDIFYWLSQRLTLPLITHFADLICVTGQHDKDRLCRRGISPDRVVVVRGGVDLALADSTDIVPGPSYDAVYIGRLHVQKGVLQLLDIWNRVQALRPGSRLAIIGDGPLLEELLDTRHHYALTDFVDVHGFLDGEEKFRIIKRSRVVVHPALYDSGGMAACEAFACGLPGVCFDLPELSTYYPQGMKKVPAYDLDAFAEAIASLIEDSEERNRLSALARQLAEKWDWDSHAAELCDEMGLTPSHLA